MVSRFQEIHKQFIIFGPYGYVNIVILGSEIPKWFTHQSVGNIVNAKVFFFDKSRKILLKIKPT